MNDPLDEHDASPPRPLPRRPPKPFGMHALVDAGIAFLVILIPLLFFRIDLGTIVLIGLLLGAALAPITRGIEMRMLEQRPEADAP